MQLVFQLRSLPPLVSDPLAIEQIFGNLLEIAVKCLSRNRAVAAYLQQQGT